MKILFGGIVIFTLVVIIHYFYFLFGFSIGDSSNVNFYLDGNITLEKKGVFGDYTSGHFSVLAFLWLFYGILIQSKEFKLQRDEFENQTKIFAEQNLLYTEQIKEAEINSIQNHFDRKINILTNLEKSIADVLDLKGDIYQFISKCEKNDSIGHFTKKIYMIEKYIKLYEALQNYIVSNNNKIDLTSELRILKEDIYVGLKVSYLIILYMMIKWISESQNHVIEVSPKKIYELQNLEVYKMLLSIYDKSEYGFSAIHKLFPQLNGIDELNIFIKKRD